MNGLPILCPRCLAVIGHGHLAEHGDDIGGWVERLPHECPKEATNDRASA